MLPFRFSHETCGSNINPSRRHCVPLCVVRIAFSVSFNGSFFSCRGPDEPRPTDVRERARHPGVRHDVRDEKQRRPSVHAGAAGPLQPGADNQATGQTAEDPPFVGRLPRLVDNE